MVDTIKVQTLKTLATLITTAFALVAGLAWNEAIKTVIGLFLQKGSEVIGMIVYALVVTVIAVVITVVVGRSLGKIGVDLED